MIKRFIGDLEIQLQYCGQTSDNRAKYLGCILLPDGQCHNFADLQSRVGCPGIWAEDFDDMAEAIVDFAVYYTSDNRGDNTPDSAPSAELADAIAKAAMPGVSKDEGYEVRRWGSPARGFRDDKGRYFMFGQGLWPKVSDD